VDAAGQGGEKVKNNPPPSRQGACVTMEAASHRRTTAGTGQEVR
jgi:hypothetical protein